MLSRELAFHLRQLVRRLGPLIGSALAIVLISYLGTSYFVNSFGQKHEYELLKRFFSIRGPRPPPPDIVLVAIDDTTYLEFAETISPRDKFPRILSARTLQRINQAKPDVVILDLKMPREPDSPEADSIIEHELRNNPNSIWSGEIPDGPLAIDPSSGKIKTITLPSDPRFVSAARMRLRMWTSSTFGLRADIAISQLPNLSPEDRFTLLPALRDLGGRVVSIPSPYDFINYYGPKNTITKLSLSRVLSMSDDELSKAFADKVVLFGYQSVDRGLGNADKDEFAVPISEATMFGVEIHANIAGNLLDGSFIKRLSPPIESLVVFLGLVCLSALGVRLTPERSIPILLAAAFLYTGAAYYSFVHKHFWIPGVTTIWIFTLVIGIACSFLHYRYLKRLGSMWRSLFDFELHK